MAEVADLTSTPDRTTVSTLKILEVAYHASFISEVIVVSQVIATWLPCPNSIAVVPPVPEIVTVAASVDPIYGTISSNAAPINTLFRLGFLPPKFNPMRLANGLFGLLPNIATTYKV